MIGMTSRVWLLAGAAFVVLPVSAQAQQAPNASPQIPITTATPQSAPVAPPVPAARQAAPVVQGGEPTFGDIVVTAQKRRESAQRVGIAISAFGGADLAKLNVTNVQALQSITPGLRLESPGGPSNTTFTVRGVGQRDIADQNEAAVVLFVDGAYVSWLSAAGSPLFDIERVEVLKGPQGTLFGRNATGGLINIITKKPTEKFEGYLTARAGSYDQLGSEGAISGPLTSTLSGRLSFQTDRYHGYTKNLSGPDANAQKGYNVRGQLRWKPIDRLTVDFLARSTWFAPAQSQGVSSRPLIVDAGGMVRSPASRAEFVSYCNAAFPTAGLFGYTLAPPGSEKAGNCFTADGANRFKGNFRSAKYHVYYQDYSTTAAYNLTDTIALTSITDYQHINKVYDSDPSATVFPRLFDYYTKLHGDQFTQELRLNGGGDRYRWVAGGFYFYRKDNVNSYIDLYNNPSFLAKFGANYRVKSRSIAGFGQGEYDLSNALTAIVGGRFTHDKKTLVNNPYCESNPVAFGAIVPGLSQCAFLGAVVFPNSVQFNGYDGGFGKNSVSAKAQLDYKPTQNVLIYAGVNRGTKSGGFNSGGAAFYGVNEVIYKPETLYAYEAGFKTTLFDRTTTLNGAIFYYDYHNYQSYLSVAGSLKVFNVDATVKGAEIELNTRPIAGVTLRASANYLHARQHDVPYLSGSRDFVMPNAPKLTFTGLARYEFDAPGGKIGLQGSTIYVGRRTTSAIDYPDLRLKQYVKTDLRGDYTTNNRAWTFAVFVDNVANKQIPLIRVNIEALTGGTSDAIDRPRWIGGSITRQF